jgi:hypothetical protein
MMEKKRFIGWGMTVSACVFLALLFTLYTLPSSTFAADKLVVKDGSGNTKFLVDDSGKVGIGGIPSAALDVYTPAGQNPTYRLCDGDLNQPFTTVGFAPEVTVNTAGQIQVNNGTSGGLSINGLCSGDNVPLVLIGHIGSTAPTKAAVIIRGWKSNGTTGRADLASTERVFRIDNGNSANIFSVMGNGAVYQRGALLHADYVFEPTYKMESIEEHAKYMWENKHLKAVPGLIKDENGQEMIEVGSHQRGILEELEKAHIYIEQLDNKIKALEAKLKALEK